MITALAILQTRPGHPTNAARSPRAAGITGWHPLNAFGVALNM